MESMDKAMTAMTEQLEAAGGLWAWVLIVFAFLLFGLMVVFIRLSSAY
jgi:hypothetical protein